MLDDAGRIDLAKVPVELQGEINKKLAEMKAGFRALDLAEEIGKMADDFQNERIRKRIFDRGSSDYRLDQIQDRLHESRIMDARMGEKTSDMTKALEEQERNARRQVLIERYENDKKIREEAKRAYAKAKRDGADEETLSKFLSEYDSADKNAKQTQSDLLTLEQEAVKEADEMGKASKDPRNRDPREPESAESRTKVETASQGTFDALETMRGLGLSGSQNLAKKQCSILESIERNTRSDDDYL